MLYNYTIIQLNYLIGEIIVPVVSIPIIGIVGPKAARRLVIRPARAQQAPYKTLLPRFTRIPLLSGK